MHYKRLQILVSILAFTHILNAQIPVGSWQTHLSYGKGTSVTSSDNTIYSISDGSLFAYRTDDQSVTTYSKLNGLSDVFMSIVRYDNITKKLVMGYENGNIDILEGNNITNIPDIKLKTISGSKSINNLRFANNFAYLALDFGIVVLNLDRFEIRETYQLNFGGVANSVNDVELSGDTLFAATDQGLYYGLLTDNLIDQRNWKNYEKAPENDKPYYVLGKVNEFIIGARSDNKSRFSVFVLNGLNQKKVGEYNSLRRFQSIDDLMFFYAETAIIIYSSTLVYQEQQNLYDLSGDYPEDVRLMDVNDGINISGDQLYVSDEKLGLIKIDWKTQSSILTPKGPERNELRRLSITPEALRIVHGGVTSSWNTAGIPGGVSALSEDVWTNLSEKNTDELKSQNDFMDIAVDPLDPNRYFTTSWGYGVFEFIGEEVENRFDEFNSSLQNIIPGGPFIRTNGLAFDDEGNLWVTNSEVAKPISCLKTDGSWVSLRYTEIDNGGDNKIYALGKILISEDKNKWVVVPRTQGLFIFDNNNTIDDVTDDIKRFLEIYDAETGAVISNDVYDIVQDLDGTMWVATASGPVLYYNVSTVLDNINAPFPAYRIKIPRNDGTGRADYLLDGEKIQAIAVDGGNRKWVGTTTSGLFLFSPDGLETVQHFTVDNSPLLSNTILDIEIDGESGEVFIATDKGLISYRSDATGGNPDFSNLRVFPNPVREDYTGDVIISGLVPETNVKITDISGNLVYETTSNGGTASWNARNFYGQKVGTGVYLIFCSDKTGEESAMVKVMVIN